jgi:hypothetical protein
MPDLNDLNKPVTTDTEPTVLDTIRGHINRVATWSNWTSTANKMAGLMSAATTAVGGGRSLRLYRRNDANTAEEEVVTLPGMSIGGNSATATGLQADLSGTPHQVKTVWDSTNSLWNLRGYLGSTDQAGVRVSFADSLLNTLPVNKGGTGAASLTGYVLGNGTGAFTASATVPVADILGTLGTSKGGTGLTSFTANGLVYASSTSALATSGAATFDGTNFATTGTATATKLVPTGNVTAGNGMYLPATNTVALSTNGTERLRLDSSGNLGIGTQSPQSKLDVSGTGSTYMQVRSSNASTGSGYFTTNATRSWLIGAGAHSGNNNLEFRDFTGSTTRMTLDTSSNLSIGTTTANARLTVSGSVSWTTGASFAGAGGGGVWVTGFGSQAINASIQATDSIAGANIYAISDVRLKSNIKPIPSGLAFVKEVSAVQFTWKESGIEDTGFIAQDLLKKGFGHLVSAIPDGAMQELVHDDGNVSPAGSRFVVKYDSVVPILCKAIQEQQALIENLLARVAEIEARWPT